MMPDTGSLKPHEGKVNGWIERINKKERAFEQTL